jgi:hypothetical protein
MPLRIGRWEVGISVALGAGAAWLLDLSPAVSAALGVLLVPLVSVADVGSLSTRGAPRRAEGPPRGLCHCGHLMSMHCLGDCSGPCAVSDCRCAGPGVTTPTQ